MVCLAHQHGPDIVRPTCFVLILRLLSRQRRPRLVPLGLIEKSLEGRHSCCPAQSSTARQ